LVRYFVAVGWCDRSSGCSSSRRASARCSGVSIIPPYDTYILYEVYITPGLMAMIQLFNGMQSSLSIWFMIRRVD
jgi:hypothetical protein